MWRCERPSYMKMDRIFSFGSLLVCCFSAIVVVVVVCSWRLFNWVWLTPKKLEKRLREQGLRGNSYRPLFGDLKEQTTIFKEAKSKPINLSDDILPRVSPFIHKTIMKYGKTSFIWLGPTPAVIIMNPELIKEVLSKNYDFQKPNAAFGEKNFLHP